MIEREEREIAPERDPEFWLGEVKRQKTEITRLYEQIELDPKTHGFRSPEEAEAVEEDVTEEIEEEIEKMEKGLLERKTRRPKRKGRFEIAGKPVTLEEAIKELEEAAVYYEGINKLPDAIEMIRGLIGLYKEKLAELMG